MKQNREPQINPHAFRQLILGEIDNGEKSSACGVGKVEQSHVKMKLENTLTSYTKTNSKGIKDLNISQDIIKLLEENINKTFFDISFNSIFLGHSPKAIEIKAKVNKWDPVKLICFCKAKKTIN